MDGIQTGKGKHSTVYFVGKYAVKVFDERCLLNFKKEAKALTLLQPFGFVPTLYSLGPNFVVMERVEGCEIKRVKLNPALIERCLECCFILDALGIQKEEMHRPDRHIIVAKAGKVKFIDFERSVITDKPSNLSQFIDYLRKRLEISRINCSEIPALLRTYKKADPDEKLKIYSILKKRIINAAIGV